MSRAINPILRKTAGKTGGGSRRGTGRASSLNGSSLSSDKAVSHSGGSRFCHAGRGYGWGRDSLANQAQKWVRMAGPACGFTGWNGVRNGEGNNLVNPHPNKHFPGRARIAGGGRGAGDLVWSGRAGAAAEGAREWQFSVDKNVELVVHSNAAPGRDSQQHTKGGGRKEMASLSGGGASLEVETKEMGPPPPPPPPGRSEKSGVEGCLGDGGLVPAEGCGYSGSGNRDVSDRGGEGIGAPQKTDGAAGFYGKEGGGVVRGSSSVSPERKNSTETGEEKTKRLGEQHVADAVSNGLAKVSPLSPPTADLQVSGRREAEQSFLDQETAGACSPQMSGRVETERIGGKPDSGITAFPCTFF